MTDSKLVEELEKINQKIQTKERNIQSLVKSREKALERKRQKSGTQEDLRRRVQKVEEQFQEKLQRLNKHVQELTDQKAKVVEQMRIQKQKEEIQEKLQRTNRNIQELLDEKVKAVRQARIQKEKEDAKKMARKQAVNQQQRIQEERPIPKPVYPKNIFEKKEGQQKKPELSEYQKDVNFRRHQTKKQIVQLQKDLKDLKDEEVIDEEDKIDQYYQIVGVKNVIKKKKNELQRILDTAEDPVYERRFNKKLEEKKKQQELGDIKALFQNVKGKDYIREKDLKNYLGSKGKKLRNSPRLLNLQDVKKILGQAKEEEKKESDAIRKKIGYKKKPQSKRQGPEVYANDAGILYVDENNQIRFNQIYPRVLLLSIWYVSNYESSDVQRSMVKLDGMKFREQVPVTVNNQEEAEFAPDELSAQIFDGEYIDWPNTHFIGVDESEGEMVPTNRKKIYQKAAGNIPPTSKFLRPVKFDPKSQMLFGQSVDIQQLRYIKFYQENGICTSQAFQIFRDDYKKLTGKSFKHQLQENEQFTQAKFEEMIKEFFPTVQILGDTKIPFYSKIHTRQVLFANNHVYVSFYKKPLTSPTFKRKIIEAIFSNYDQQENSAKYQIRIVDDIDQVCVKIIREENIIPFIHKRAILFQDVLYIEKQMYDTAIRSRDMFGIPLLEPSMVHMFTTKPDGKQQEITNELINYQFIPLVFDGVEKKEIFNQCLENQLQKKYFKMDMNKAYKNGLLSCSKMKRINGINAIFEKVDFCKYQFVKLNTVYYQFQFDFQGFQSKYGNGDVSNLISRIFAVSNTLKGDTISIYQKILKKYKFQMFCIVEFAYQSVDYESQFEKIDDVDEQGFYKFYDFTVPIEINPLKKQVVSQYVPNPEKRIGNDQQQKSIQNEEEEKRLWDVQQQERIKNGEKAYEQYKIKRTNDMQHKLFVNKTIGTFLHINKNIEDWKQVIMENQVNLEFWKDIEDAKIKNYIEMLEDAECFDPLADDQLKVDELELVNNRRKPKSNYWFIHCQIINEYLCSFISEFMYEIEHVVQVHTDSVLFDFPEREFDSIQFKREAVKFDYTKGCEKKKGILFRPPKQSYSNIKIIESLAGSGKTQYIKNHANKTKDIIIVCSLLNQLEYKKDGFQNVYTYQSFYVINQFDFLDEFETVYIDELYMVSVFVLYKIFTIKNVRIVMVGDSGQNRNFSANEQQYYFVQKCKDCLDVKMIKLMENWRNNLKTYSYDSEEDIYKDEGINKICVCGLDMMIPCGNEMVKWVYRNRNRKIIVLSNKVAFQINYIYQLLVELGVIEREDAKIIFKDQQLKLKADQGMITDLEIPQFFSYHVDDVYYSNQKQILESQQYKKMSKQDILKNLFVDCEKVANFKLDAKLDKEDKKSKYYYGIAQTQYILQGQGIENVLVVTDGMDHKALYTAVTRLKEPLTQQTITKNNLFSMGRKIDEIRDRKFKNMWDDDTQEDLVNIVRYLETNQKIFSVKIKNIMERMVGKNVNIKIDSKLDVGKPKTEIGKKALLAMQQFFDQTIETLKHIK